MHARDDRSREAATRPAGEDRAVSPDRSRVLRFDLRDGALEIRVHRGDELLPRHRLPRRRTEGLVAAVSVAGRRDEHADVDGCAEPAPGRVRRRVTDAVEMTDETPRTRTG